MVSMFNIKQLQEDFIRCFFFIGQITLSVDHTMFLSWSLLFIDEGEKKKNTISSEQAVKYGIKCLQDCSD